MVADLVVGRVGRVGLVGNHKEGKVQEEILARASDTSLVDRRKAYQGNHEQEARHGPIHLAEGETLDYNQDVQRGGQEEEGLVAEGLVAVVLEELEGQRVVGCDVEELVLVLPVVDEIRSA